jgi:hypothetical protein
VLGSKSFGDRFGSSAPLQGPGLDGNPIG